MQLQADTLHNENINMYKIWPIIRRYKRACAGTDGGGAERFCPKKSAAHMYSGILCPKFYKSGYVLLSARVMMTLVMVIGQSMTCLIGLLRCCLPASNLNTHEKDNKQNVIQCYMKGGALRDRYERADCVRRRAR